jgi:hypothetical protein
MRLEVVVVSVTATNVLLLGDRLEMRRVHTGTVAAQVVDLQAAGDWPDQELIGDAVCALGSTLDAELPVAIVSDMSDPHPACVRLVDASPEAIKEQCIHQTDASSRMRATGGLH